MKSIDSVEVLKYHALYLILAKCSKENHRSVYNRGAEVDVLTSAPKLALTYSDGRPFLILGRLFQNYFSKYFTGCTFSSNHLLSRQKRVRQIGQDFLSLSITDSQRLDAFTSD